MDDVQEKLRRRARELLESGEVATFIGWEAHRFEHKTTPLIFTDPAWADRLVFNEYCVNTIAKYAIEAKAKGKVGLCVRGCDSRAVNRMIQDNQLTRDDVYLIGLACPGMKDAGTDELLSKCSYCLHKNPLVFDEMIGSEVAEGAATPRWTAVEQIEALDRVARSEYFDNMFSKCLRCYACRNVCPCCTCKTCFVDSRRVAWQGKQNNLNENRFYGITRALHIADRCIECGECERVCPMELPLMTLNRKLIKDMNDLFGANESGLDTENPDALRNYKLDDLEEFM